MLASVLAVVADVPPEPGQKRVTVKLAIEAAEDFPDYRFFIKCGADLEEVNLKKGDRRVIEPLGGGAWYRSGTLLAVPRKSLAGLSETDSGEKLNELEKSVYDGKTAGIVELIKHGFVREVPDAEASSVKDVVYRIEKDGEKGVKATAVSGGSAETKGDTGSGFTIYSKEAKTPFFWMTVVGGSVMTLAFIALGVWFARRSRRRIV